MKPMKIRSFWLALLLAALPFTAFANFQALTSQKVWIGKFNSRAIWTAIHPTAPGDKSPAVILIPGSGANGPEEMVPPSYTGDGQAHSLFKEISAPFNQAGINTLALGKPGIEFFSSWDRHKFYYDRDLYVGLHWQDLLDNVAAAVQFLRKQPGVDPERIYILGHSEGTQVAVDYAHLDPQIAGVILLGYAGEDLSTIADWQLFRRDIDLWIAPEVDTNHDGFVSRKEASSWSQYPWPWQTGEDKLSYEDIEAAQRKSPELISEYNAIKNSGLYKDGMFNRGPIYDLTASLTRSVYVFTGSLDVQTPPQEAETLSATCRKFHKSNCHVTIVPGLGHGFSPPRAPRGQPLLDSTLGPVDPSFQTVLFDLGKRLEN